MTRAPGNGRPLMPARRDQTSFVISRRVTRETNLRVKVTEKVRNPPGKQLRPRMTRREAIMKPINDPSGIDRRVLLSTLALAPVLSAPLFSAPTLAQAPGEPLPSWNDG